MWKRFGDTPNFVDPFFGSNAILLARPFWSVEQSCFTVGPPTRVETVNDADAYVANFNRALQADPDAVAFYADAQVNEADLHARHAWLLSRAEFREKMHSDPDFYDAKIAGWWVWGLCSWIGSGWCGQAYYNRNGKQQLPHLGNAGEGVHRASQQLPHLGDAGRGVHRAPRQRPQLSRSGKGIPGGADNAGYGDLYAYMRALSARLRRVRVCCGDWTRVLGPTPTEHIGLTGVFLDPPYPASADRDMDLYAVDDGEVAHAVREWAIAHGDNPMFRIALCGYEHEGYDMPPGWTAVAWKAPGGYGGQGNKRGRENAKREVIWFSKSCLNPMPTLFEYADRTGNSDNAEMPLVGENNEEHDQEVIP